jgi:hypothetical protein
MCVTCLDVTVVSDWRTPSIAGINRILSHAPVNPGGTVLTARRIVPNSALLRELPEAAVFLRLTVILNPWALATRTNSQETRTVCCSPCAGGRYSGGHLASIAPDD